VIRKTVHFSGEVQGVGFRFTTHRIAGGYDVTGYVRNLADGRVELVAEGEPEAVDEFVSAVESDMGRHIADTQVATSEATGEFRRFDIQM
jgi:acylphosphatase